MVPYLSNIHDNMFKNHISCESNTSHLKTVSKIKRLFHLNIYQNETFKCHMIKNAKWKMSSRHTSKIYKNNTKILRVCCEIWTPVIILLSLLFSLVDASMVVWTTFNQIDNTHYLSRVKWQNKHNNANRKGKWR